MPRKQRESAATPATPKPDPVKPKFTDECTYGCDGGSHNQLVIQTIEQGSDKQFRIFVRPDDPSEPTSDEQWDAHESDEQTALETLFKTYGKGEGTRIEIWHNLKTDTINEFFLNVWKPKPNAETDDEYLKVCIDVDDPEGEIVAELVDEIKGKRVEPDTDTLQDEHDAIEDLLIEFDMPGDLPAHLDYTLSDRLRSIFRTVKGLPK
jgi:hypothetical protein